jgi:hypothetical protein
VSARRVDFGEVVIVAVPLAAGPPATADLESIGQHHPSACYRNSA